MSVLRENSIKRDNWNMFVGDPRYKTNFFLQFLDRSTKSLYDRGLVGQAAYSIRLMVLFILFWELVLFIHDECQKDGCMGKRILVLALAIVSLLGTSKYGKNWNIHLQKFTIVRKLQ
jgi:hypothetical protein